jgi:hypothetical protein
MRGYREPPSVPTWPGTRSSNPLCSAGEAALTSAQPCNRLRTRALAAVSASRDCIYGQEGVSHITAKRDAKAGRFRLQPPSATDGGSCRLAPAGNTAPIAATIPMMGRGLSPGLTRPQIRAVSAAIRCAGCARTFSPISEGVFGEFPHGAESRAILRPGRLHTRYRIGFAALRHGSLLHSRAQPSLCVGRSQTNSIPPRCAPR